MPEVTEMVLLRYEHAPGYTDEVACMPAVVAILEEPLPDGRPRVGVVPLGPGGNHPVNGAGAAVRQVILLDPVPGGAGVPDIPPMMAWGQTRRIWAEPVTFNRPVFGGPVANGLVELPRMEAAAPPCVVAGEPTFNTTTETTTTTPVDPAPEVPVDPI